MPKAVSCLIRPSTSDGSIRLGQAARGAGVLGAACGDLTVGIAAGAAVNPGPGQVRNTLHVSGTPEETEGTVEIRARTRRGDIDIRRAQA
ncbi:hypothetical protein ACIA74_44825 [Streptomyces sp. NPDC051658]|uniref:hypothetical protein n=1 Tax=Streptomyces sp. NPDC051658 TaxID=3365667 RepID=UPI0037923623